MMSPSTLFLLLLLSPVATALACACTLGSAAKRVVTGLLLTGLGISFVAALLMQVEVSGGAPLLYEGARWMDLSVGSGGGGGLSFSFLADTLSAWMVLLVTGIGWLVAVFSVQYMGEDERYGTYGVYLSLFVAAMLVLVLAANLPLLFLGWEGVGLCSYLLIGFWWKRPAFANAGRKAFLVNRVADFFFLVGMVALYYGARSFDVAVIASVPGSLMTTVEWSAWVGLEGGRFSWAWLGALCLGIACMGKSAQWPFHVWLPDAMAGPTPVSALIHAATMVTAGVYLVCRLHPLFAAVPDVGAWMAVVGAWTACVAGLVGCVQPGLKRTLAYSTVSQLGFMFCAVGLGAVSAGFFHVFTHAFFKALLFLGAGAIMWVAHAHDEVELGSVHGLRREQPLLHWTIAVGLASLAGVPLFSGFFSKESILLAAMEAREQLPPALWMAVIGGLIVASCCTAFYCVRMYMLMFCPSRCLAGPQHGAKPAEAHQVSSGLSMWIAGPLLVLALGAVLAGWLDARALHLPWSLWSTWFGVALPERQALASAGSNGAGALHAETLTLIAGLFSLLLGGLASWWAHRGGRWSRDMLSRTLRGQEGMDAAHEDASLPREPRWRVTSMDAWQRRFLVQPLWRMSAALHGIDRAFFGTVLLGGWSKLQSGLGWLVTRVQAGSVYVSALVMVVGLFCVTLWMIYPQAHFDAQEMEPGQGAFHARSGLGYKYRWDFESDGVFGSSWGEAAKVVEHRFQPRDAKAWVLWVEYPNSAPIQFPLQEGRSVSVPEARVNAGKGPRAMHEGERALITHLGKGVFVVRPRSSSLRIEGKTRTGQELSRLQPSDTFFLGEAKCGFRYQTETTLAVRSPFGNELRVTQPLLLTPILETARASR